MRTTLAVVLAVVVVAACGGASTSPAPPTAPSLRTGEFAIPTISPPFGSTPEACPAALTTGILIEDPAGGLGLDRDGDTTRVRWPFGWRGANGPPAALVDDTGAVIATVGQQVEVGGGFINDWWLGCGGVRVVE
jgi:hypothetical protein